MDRAPALSTATVAVATRRVGEGLMVPLGGRWVRERRLCPRSVTLLT
jgi:hypothetical protein